VANLTFFSLKYGDFMPFLLKKSLRKTEGPAFNQTKIQKFFKIEKNEDRKNKNRKKKKKKKQK